MTRYATRYNYVARLTLALSCFCSVFTISSNWSSSAFLLMVTDTAMQTPDLRASWMNEAIPWTQLHRIYHFIFSADSSNIGDSAPKIVVVFQELTFSPYSPWAATVLT